MAAPTLQAEGTLAVVTTGNLTVTLPAHQANDILIVANGFWGPNSSDATIAPTVPTGWTQITAVIDDILFDGSIHYYWRRATSGAEASPVFTRPFSAWDTGTDTAWGGRAYVIRGCATTGDPWDQVSESAKLTAANGSVPAVTVSGIERMVVQFLVKTDDYVSGPTVSGWVTGAQVESATGTDHSQGTFRKNNISTSTTAQASTVEAPAQGFYAFLGISFKPPSTGASLARTAADTITTVTEAVSRVVTLVRSTPDTITSITESISRTTSLFRTMNTDSAEVQSDSVNRVLVYPRIVSDTITSISDSVSRAVTFARTLIDNLSVTDSVARVVLLARTLSDTISIGADAVGRFISSLRTTLDTTSTSESVARAFILFGRSVNDTITTVTDSLARSAISFLRVTSDSITSITDSVARTIGWLRSAVDTTTVSDAVARLFTATRIALDTTTHSESVNRAAITFGRTVNDTLGAISDSVTRAAQLVRGVAESIAIGADTAVIATAVILYRVVSDTVSIGADAVGRVVTMMRSTSDSVTGSDAVVRVISVVRSLVDSVITSDTLSRWLTMVRNAVDTTSVTDSVARAGLLLARVVSDSVSGITDSIVRVANKVRLLIETTSVSDSINRSWTGMRSMVDTLPAIVDSVSTSLALVLYRVASDSVTTVTDSVVRVLSNMRTVTDDLITSDVADRTMAYARTISDSVMGISDFVVRGGTLVRRSVEDFVSLISDSASFISVLPRFVGEVIKSVININRFRVGQNDQSNRIGGGVNRVHVNDQGNKERVK